MFWRILVALLKPCVLLALFDCINRVAKNTSLEINVIDPVANAIYHTTGLPATYAAILVMGIVALGLLEILTAVGRVAAAAIPR